MIVGVLLDMKNFIVNGTATVSCWTIVEAETEEEALAIAESRTLAEIYVESTYADNEYFYIDADGCPQDIFVEKLK